MTDGTDPPDSSERGSTDERDIVDAGSAKGVAKARKEAERKEARRRDFWKGVLSDPVGRAEIWSFLQEGGAFAAPFAVGPNGFPQPEATWWKAGQAGLVLGLYHRLMSIDFDGVKLMLTENDPRFKAAK